ncbi:gamma-butyrobetaine hydroxylase-like domain-containing protein [Caballeronia mineralivorans]|uniref:gamma-butyrobetaine hydroxylase-like domain-containing protein n=1 Tax=Caballeronia mineralivorans TaxID=2010198 RepID=UPI0009E4BB74|nr:gamma-butyrobetaine hydroxylase-like domain-containing protein [Caballeronia mineralivorans]
MMRSAQGDVEVVDIHSMVYGVQLIFSDGHSQAIFPWPFLEALGTAAAWEPNC